jgi:hypothetical protein
VPKHYLFKVKYLQYIKNSRLHLLFVITAQDNNHGHYLNNVHRVKFLLEHNISGTGTVFVTRRKAKDVPTQLTN